MTRRDPVALIDLVDYVRQELDAGTKLADAVAAWMRRHTTPEIPTITVELVDDEPKRDGAGR